MKINPKTWSDSEIKFLKENYHEKDAYFCAKELGRSPYAIRRRAAIIGIQNKTGAKRKYQKEEFTTLVKSSKTITEVLHKLDLIAAGGSHHTIKKYIKKYDIDTSHFETPSDRAKNLSKDPVPLVEILVENSNYSRFSLKRRLYKEGFKQPKCELCGQGEVWHGKRMSLILDHINGIRNDNRLSNLRIVCPNCNATLETHCGKNRRVINRCIDCNVEITRKSTRCMSCGQNSEAARENQIKRRKVKNRPSPSQLAADIAELGYLGTGRKYGVSDNAVRKWEKSYSNG